MKKKFGLEELEGYAKEVGLKRGDFRTIKGVLNIVGIPNVVAEEIDDAVAGLKVVLTSTQDSIDTLTEEQQKDFIKTNEEIALLRAELNKRTTERTQDTLAHQNSVRLGLEEAKRLEKLLKKFS